MTIPETVCEGSFYKYDTISLYPHQTVRAAEPGVSVPTWRTRKLICRKLEMTVVRCLDPYPFLVLP